MAKPPIHPVVWHPPPAPARARATSSARTFPPVRRISLPGFGPEDVVVDAEGRLVCGLADGRVLRVDASGGSARTLANTGGRPLGLEMLPDGAVLICDDRRGLLRLEPDSGALTVLTDAVDGERLGFCSNAVAGPDGSIYFTQSSRRFGLSHYRADLLEHSGTGRLCHRLPNGKVRTLTDGLHFANGVALTAAGDALIVAETGAFQLSRVPLDGGPRDVITANLPGFPDNIARGDDGLVWVALATPRNRQLDRLSGLPPVLRRGVWALPERVQPAPERTVWAIAINESGSVVHDLQCRRNDYHFVTGVARSGTHLYLSSLVEAALLEVDLSGLGGG